MSKANVVQHLTRAVVWEQYYSYKKHACPDHRNKSSASVSEGVRAISMSCRRSPSRGAPPVPGARQGNACLSTAADRLGVVRLSTTSSIYDRLLNNERATIDLVSGYCDECTFLSSRRRKVVLWHEDQHILMFVRGLRDQLKRRPLE